LSTAKIIFILKLQNRCSRHSIHQVFKSNPDNNSRLSPFCNLPKRKPFHRSRRRQSYAVLDRIRIPPRCKRRCIAGQNFDYPCCESQIKRNLCSNSYALRFKSLFGIELLKHILPL
jgi:hypothetical protein